MIQMAARRVLVIEDDDGARNALGSLLTDEGYDVCTAGTGTEGITIASEFIPHAVVCDYWLPDVNGLSVMRRLRADNPDLFFIMVTAGRFDRSGEKELRAEADVFLDKPVDLSALRNALFRATSETGAGRAFN